MAAFTNQFTTFDPFNLPSRSDFFYWPEQIASEAGSLLAGRSRDWLNSIATQVEGVVRRFAKSSVLPDRGPKQAHALFAQSVLRSGEVRRDSYGDVNIFLACHSLHDWKSESVLSESWERFAVLALWKVVDANAALDGLLRDPSGEFMQRNKKVAQMNFAGGHAIEAMRALQTAQVSLSEATALADQNRRNGVRANPNSEANRLRALEMADELPFRSMNKAAEHIALCLVKNTTKRGIDTYYTTEWIKRWLREATWTPRHKRKPPQ
jgi:hypothetical protein